MCCHVCQCSNNSNSSLGTRSGLHVTQAILQNLNNNHVGGQWVWSTSQAFSTSSASNTFDFASSSTQKRNCTASILSHQAASSLSFNSFQQASPNFKAIELNDSLVPAWLPQNETIDGPRGASAFVDIDGSPLDMPIDIDMQAAFPMTPSTVNQDLLPTPGLVHSPPSSRAFDSNGSGVMAARGGSSVASTSSVPATPTNLAMLDLETSVHSISRNSSELQQHDCDGVAMPAFGFNPTLQSLSSAFDFTHSPQTQTISPGSAGEAYVSPVVKSSVKPSSGCVYSASLARSSTLISPLPMPSHIAMPAPGWLDPEVLPAEMLVEADSSYLAQQAVPGLNNWSAFMSPSQWVPPATIVDASRYEPYRNSSIASTASSSSQTFGVWSPSPSFHRLSGSDIPGSRRRSLTVGSIPDLPSSLVDRVRSLDMARPQTLNSPRNSIPSSPRLGSSSRRFNSNPCRRSRPVASGMAGMAFQDVETLSIKERRIASLASRNKVVSKQQTIPLAGLFSAQDLLLVNVRSEIAISRAESSPTDSEVSLGLTSPTSLTISPPSSPTRSTIGAGSTECDAEDADVDGTVGKTKIALHHHRTKLQRNVLNELIISLQAAYKHCQRTSSYEQPTQFAAVSELDQLVLHDSQPDSLLSIDSWRIETEPSWSTSGVVIPGETKEMRKNRQKAESKMRIRRKEIAQFAALVCYAQMAYAHVIATCDTTEDVVGRSLAQVFLESREAWSTLVAMEKRLFHTVRVKMGLQELVVRRLTEKLGDMTA
ncbi:uncharacterized protein MEPE_06641 [Melanopsichium pennsylvanicum]|uniref:Uncharacterized protein n=2 Tax=Melanopsichium pennsylvanicum TaxID=63383 RepID=A0AAJ5C8E9_9BASI|nr:hypothetical protein BN887_02868 [Melanopsichium pennsylvanicum 4]SNX87930.1 uncharacterized protein MEPE_06641 [Melanopsichium pennsylvanicum]